MSTPAIEPQALHTDTLVVDGDVHETLSDYKLLLPYLDPHWHRMITGDGGSWPGIAMEGGYAKPPLPLAGGYSKPMARNTCREDWQDEGQMAGTNHKVLRRDLIEGMGVTTPILSGLFRGSRVEHDYEFMVALASAYNDWLIEEWLDKDPQLYGSVQVIAHQPELAAREIDRVGAHPQMVQVLLPTVENRQYGDPMYRPIYEAALRNDLVIAMHHSADTACVLGFPRYFIEWHTLAPPQCNQAQVVSFICNGTFDKYPDLKLVVLETGVAWLPWLMWRLDQQYRELRANVPWVKRLPSEHIRDNVRFTTQPATDVPTEDFVKLVEMVDSEDVWIFATDYPHYDADEVDMVLSGGLPAGLRDKIRYQNALATYPRLRGLGT
jgi:predicted TIM-barrel fold metal-dependent hydrolase